MTTEMLEALKAQAHRYREQGEAMAAEANDLAKASQKRGISALERAYFQLIASSRETLVVAFHAAAGEIEKGISILTAD